MTKPIARDPIYRQRLFNADIIELCVRWYITYRLSYRDLVEMMAERGVKVAHSTILRWVTRYVESHFAWDAWSIRRERLAKECLCGRNSTVAAEQEID